MKANSKRIKCPKCNSLKIMGNRMKFKCKNCGFTHDTKKEALKNATTN